MTKQIKQRWSNVLKSGTRALEVVRDAINHVQQHGDTSLLANMIAQAEAADMKVYGQRVRLLTGAVFTEAKIRKTKDGGIAITKGDAFDQTAALAIEAFVDEGVSLIGSKVQDRFGQPKVADTPEQALEKQLKRDCKFILDSDEMSLETYIAELRKAYAKAAAAKLEAAAA